MNGPTTTAAAPDRGLRFDGVGNTNQGLVLTATGAVSTISGDDAIRQAILMLLCTRPGERLMRPAYGSMLHRLLFAPIDHTTAGLAIHYVRQAIERWEPRVEVLDVDAEPDPDRPNRLNIQLRYRVRRSLTVAQLTYPLDLGTPTIGGAR
jgi:phage baseplate assembly protein W